MQALVEYGLGGLAVVIGGWVLYIGGLSIKEAYRRVREMRMRAEALEQFMEDQDEDHKNGNGKVA